MIPLSEPFLTELDQRYVQECVASGWVSSAGPWVTRFEEALAKYTGARHVVALGSGTSALHLALLIAGVKPGELVIMPDLTFVASANAVRYCGADPWLVDIDPNHWQMDVGLATQKLPELIQKKDGGWHEKTSGRRIAAILLVHVLGYGAYLDEWKRFATSLGIPLIEDAAEALGSRYKGRHLGTFGEMGCLSFNGNKVMTTGGGGALLTDDETIARKARHLSTQARTDAFTYQHDEIGYNYRLSGMSAALGLSQLEQLPHFLAKKAEIMARYQQVLGTAFRFPDVDAACVPNHWLCTARTPDRDGLAEKLLKCEIQTRALWMPMHMLPMYAETSFLTEEIHSTSLFKEALSLPSSVSLTEEGQEQVIRVLVDK